jgi:hypothetical protein
VWRIPSRTRLEAMDATDRVKGARRDLSAVVRKKVQERVRASVGVEVEVRVSRTWVPSWEKAMHVTPCACALGKRRTHCPVLTRQTLM